MVLSVVDDGESADHLVGGGWVHPDLRGDRDHRGVLGDTAMVTAAGSVQLELGALRRRRAISGPPMEISEI